MRIAPCLIAVTALAAAAASAADAPKAGWKELEGSWKLVAGERGGKPIPADQLPTGTIEFGPGGAVKAVLSTFEMEGTATLDEAKTPRLMVVTHRKGDAKGEKQYVVYKVEGDKLTVCSGPPGGAESERPTSFDTKEGDHTAFTFERAK